MNCKKWEQQIYLYDDLTPSERKQLEDHLLACESCAVTMQTARKGMEMTREARKANIELENPDLLTRAIMNKIRSVGVSRPRSVLAAVLDHIFTRYAFAGASILLLAFFVFFLVEQTADVRVYKVMPHMRTVTLNSSAFLKNIQEGQKKKEGNTVLVLYGCAKQDNCDNAIVKNLKRRFKS